jgi:hypothetical protein
MITKKHWSIICHKINESRRFHPFIQGKRVVKVDLANDIVVTSLQGEPRTVFTFDSVIGKSYGDITRSVKLTNVSLFDMVNK